MFTYELLGIPSESGIPRVLDRSMTPETDLKAAIAQAKMLLKRRTILPAGEPYGIRILDNDSVLVWTGNINDA
jgi:hypothetical protein